jgi:hypothetical protein
MQPHNHDGSGHEPEDRRPEQVDASLGYERSDVGVTGILVFMAAMAIFVAVTAVLCYGVGKAINAYLNRQDGPNTRWTRTVDIRQLGDLPSNPAMQNKVAELMQSFPTPRLQIDNGDQEVADLHAREDLLLDHYSWIDQSKGTVRVPIGRAMELLAKQGLPVAPPAQHAPPMTGDSRPVVTLPLTDGFAPTGFEQQEIEQRTAEAARGGQE